MLQLGLIADFKCKFQELYDAVVPMKEPGNLIGKQNLPKREMHEVDM